MTPSTLMRCALEETNELQYWGFVHSLQKCEPRGVWRMVRPLADAADAAHRAFAVDVLRWLGGDARPLQADTLALYREMLARETHEDVLCALANAFVDVHHDDAAAMLAPLAAHASVKVRLATMHGLTPNAYTAVSVLVLLSRDENADVRNWATFALGQQLGAQDDPRRVDTRELRDALAARLDDESDEVRAEAAFGLALRGDARAVPAVARARDEGSDHDAWFEAGAALTLAGLVPGRA